MTMKLRPIESLRDIKLVNYCKFLEVQAGKNNDASEEEATEFVIDAVHALNPERTREYIKGMPIKEVIKYYVDTLCLIDTKEIGETISVYKVGKYKLGLEPNFQAMEAGAYIDIHELSQAKTQQAYLLMMAILYRPITGMYGKKIYSISKYEGEISQSIENRAKFLGEHLTGEAFRNAMVNFARVR